eukprot:Hpha_TRINITY_DN15292_c8_g8::TRINITY_DN15292_c8_g8_i1::g.68353::m.68353
MAGRVVAEEVTALASRCATAASRWATAASRDARRSSRAARSSAFLRASSTPSSAAFSFCLASSSALPASSSRLFRSSSLLFASRSRRATSSSRRAAASILRCDSSSLWLLMECSGPGSFAAVDASSTPSGGSPMVARTERCLLSSPFNSVTTFSCSPNQPHAAWGTVADPPCGCGGTAGCRCSRACNSASHSASSVCLRCMVRGVNGALAPCDAGRPACSTARGVPTLPPGAPPTARPRPPLGGAKPPVGGADAVALGGCRSGDPRRGGESRPPPRSDPRPPVAPPRNPDCPNPKGIAKTASPVGGPVGGEKGGPPRTASSALANAAALWGRGAGAAPKGDGPPSGPGPGGCATGGAPRGWAEWRPIPGQPPNPGGAVVRSVGRAGVNSLVRGEATGGAEPYGPGCGGVSWRGGGGHRVCVAGSGAQRWLFISPTPTPTPSSKTDLKVQK